MVLGLHTLACLIAFGLATRLGKFWSKLVSLDTEQLQNTVEPPTHFSVLIGEVVFLYCKKGVVSTWSYVAGCLVGGRV